MLWQRGEEHRPSPWPTASVATGSLMGPSTFRLIGCEILDRVSYERWKPCLDFFISKTRKSSIVEAVKSHHVLGSYVLIIVCLSLSCELGIQMKVALSSIPVAGSRGRW